MDEILAGALLDLVVSQGDHTLVTKMDGKQGAGKKQSRGAKIWLGGDEARTGGRYVPVLQKAKTEAVDVRNAKWLEAKQRKNAIKAAALQKEEA
jgi:tRNA pseudouridine38/39 synthase